jgi:hypothetical protein
MGMLIDFYTGDTGRIIDALKGSNWDKLARGGIVSAHADLSFHLWPDDLDQLVRCACALLNRPTMTFAQSIQSDIVLCPPDAPEGGVHEMSNAFIDLFAAISPDQSASLCEMWLAQMPEPPPVPRPTGIQRFMRGIQDRFVYVVCAAVFIPLLAAYWLFSRRLREARRQGKRKRAMAGKKTTSAPTDTLPDAIAALITTCQVAKAQGKSVVYAWGI